MEGPPEIVAGIVMNVMTSCSLRPASRAKNPPMAWMPSCEFPAMRMTASETLEIFGEEPPAVGAVDVWSLMKMVSASNSSEPCKAHTEDNQQNAVALTQYHGRHPCQTRNVICM